MDKLAKQQNLILCVPFTLDTIEWLAMSTDIDFPVCFAPSLSGNSWIPFYAVRDLVQYYPGVLLLKQAGIFENFRDVYYCTTKPCVATVYEAWLAFCERKGHIENE